MHKGLLNTISSSDENQVNMDDTGLISGLKPLSPISYTGLLYIIRPLCLLEEPISMSLWDSSFLFLLTDSMAKDIFAQEIISLMS